MNIQENNERINEARLSSWETIFHLDLRSLSLFRIWLGILLLFDLGLRATALRAHYTDWGIMPRRLHLSMYGDSMRYSLHLLDGDLGPQIFLFLIAAIFAFTLTIGYKTRISLFISWILLVSLQNRNPLLLNSGDTLLRLLLFWSLFLPLATNWSIDAISNKAKVLVKWTCSIRTAAIIIQICLVYWFTALEKHGETWWDGSALSLALEADYLTTRFGN